MAYDAHSNLAYATVAVAPSPATSGTSLTVANGLGSLFPTAPFNCTVYPSGSSPLASNSEIVRVTNVVGDVFTIVRAQEGTTARSIATGWQIANTATKLVFTDIENSIIQFISAGTTKASAPEVVFSNSNGVSFGASGSVITASVLGGGGGSGGAAISAGTQSQSTGTVIFSNSNGVTFGLDNGTLTASINALTSQSNQAASASNGSFAFQTLGFSNANNVTFGTSAGSIITASINPGGQSTQPVAASASNGSFLFSTIGFSNGNGVTFGSSAGGIISASVETSYLTSQSNQAASASNGSFTFQTIAFSNANNVTFGTSAGSIITASVGTAAAGNSVNFSAGTTSNNLGSIVFSNSNGISFGLNGATITASGGGANTFSLDFWENFQVQTLTEAFLVATISNRPAFWPFFVPNGNINLNTVNIILQRNGATSLDMDYKFAFYSFANSSQLSLYTSASQRISISNSTMITGNNLQVVLTGMGTGVLTQGQWVAGIYFGGTSSVHMNMNLMGGRFALPFKFLIGGSSTASVASNSLVYPFNGMYSTTTAGFMASLGSNDLITMSSTYRAIPYFNVFASPLI